MDESCSNLFVIFFVKINIHETTGTLNWKWFVFIRNDNRWQHLILHFRNLEEEKIKKLEYGFLESE